MKKAEKKMADALVALVYERNFSDICVCDICARCGLSRQTFYNHFTDKYALAEAIFSDEVIREPLAAARTYSFSRVQCARLRTLRRELRLYQRFFQDASLSDAFAMLLRDACLAFLDGRAGISAQDETLLFAIDFYCRGCVKAVLAWLCSGAKTPVETMAERVEACLPDLLSHYLLDDYLSDYL